MTKVSALGEYLRYRSSLPPRLSEFAILVTAAHWQQKVEWEIHAPIAVKAGVPQDVIDALWHRARPRDLDDHMQAVYDIATALHEERMLPYPTRQRAEAMLGNQQVIDVIGICGYYALLAMVLNARRP
jgi:4-carboxymuconolactone decarboxylase